MNEKCSELSIDNIDAVMKVYEKDVRPDALIYFQRVTPFYDSFINHSPDEIIHDIIEIPCIESLAL